MNPIEKAYSKLKAFLPRSLRPRRQRPRLRARALLLLGMRGLS